MRSLLLPSFILATTSIPIYAADSIIDEIITTTERRDSNAPVVSNIAILGKETLEDIGALHIEDSLVRLPGVAIHQGSGQEYLPSIRSATLTGGGACGSFLMAQDSIPLRAAGFCNVNELFEANSEHAERIEVIRGPSNALFGSNAQHGVVNVILPGPPSEQQASLGLEVGSHDFRRQDLTFGDNYGDSGLLINLTTSHDGGFRDDSYYDQQKLHVRYDTKLANWDVATAFTASNLNQETAGFAVGTDVYKDRDLSEQNPNPEAFRDARSFRLYSRFSVKFDNDQSLQLTPYLRKTEMDFLQHFLPGTPLEENGQQSLGFAVTWYDDSGESVNWIFGLDSEITNGYLKQTQQVPSFGPFPTGKHYDYEVDAIQLAPYASLNWDVTDTFLLSAGLRYETMRYDYDNLMVDGRSFDDGTPCAICRYSRPSDRKDSFNNWSPKVGGLFRLNENHEIFSNIARGFRAPQATELYRLQANQVLADLDSEELDSFEIGIRGNTSSLRYEAVAYAMKKRNVIFRDSSARNNLGDGKTKHHGLELSGNWQINDAFDLSGVLNLANHRYDNNQSVSSADIDGNQEDSAPKQTGSMHLGWQFVEGARAELELVHVGEYYTDVNNENKYDGHDVFNLRTRWAVTNQLTLNARILNLTDTRYADRADFSGFVGDRYFPGMPRSIFVGGEFQF